MNFAEMFALLIGFALSLWVVKTSAQLAYKKEVTWEQAFLQWLFLLILAVIISIILSMLKFGYVLERLAFGLL